ncbi:MAG: hypothetical protein EOM58_01705 [Clostridia bacterium]|jgi:hypothetical protein|nr:hypothetical protein [Clostridia bacterium]
MKENPIDSKVRQDMQERFLGSDTRLIAQIIESDEAELRAAGLGADELARAMRRLTEKGMESLGDEVQADGFLVRVEEYMGQIGCPFKHAVREAKRNTTAVDPRGRVMTWTDMSIHLIERHGFFQGEGSDYRLEPLELAEFLGLLKK